MYSKYCIVLSKNQKKKILIHIFFWMPASCDIYINIYMIRNETDPIVKWLIEILSVFIPR